MDSGSITAIASNHFQKSNEFLKTFTVGFDLSSISGLERSFDERAKAEFMSYKFKTEHYEMVLKSGDMERCLPNFAYHLEEPRVGQSYPNYYAAKLASKFVKVVLSGVGGDELFAGYDPHFLAYWRELLKAFKWISLVNEVNSRKTPNKWKFIANEYIKQYQLDKLPKSVAKKILLKSRQDLQFIDLDWFENQFEEKFQKDRSDRKGNTLNEFLREELINNRLKTFLRCEDRCAMHHSIEARTPFSDDHALIELALKTKSASKISKGVSKHILREAGKAYLPEKVYKREDKIGFATPHNQWMSALALDKQVNFSESVTPFLNNESLNDSYTKFFINSSGQENPHAFKYLAFVEWIT